MSELEMFKNFESDFFEVLNEIDVNVQKAKDAHGAKRKQIHNSIQGSLNQAEEYMSSMEIEAGGMTMADLRESLNKKVQIYKRDMESRRVELRKLEDDETRYALMGPDVELSDGFDHTSTDYEKRMVNSTKTLDQTSNKIDQAIEILNETEDIAQETSKTLKAQGDQIKGQIDKTRGVVSKSKEGGKIMFRLNKRKVTNSIILGVIICALLVLILMIIGFIFRGPIITIVKYFLPSE